jgi:hypothetical protein
MRELDREPVTWRAIRAAGVRARRTAEAGPLARALARHGWSLTRTAVALAVDVDTLRRHLSRHHPALCRMRRRALARRA